MPSGFKCFRFIRCKALFRHSCSFFSNLCLLLLRPNASVILCYLSRLSLACILIKGIAIWLNLPQMRVFFQPEGISFGIKGLAWQMHILMSWFSCKESSSSWQKFLHLNVFLGFFYHALASLSQFHYTFFLNKYPVCKDARLRLAEKLRTN